ncbi:MAG: aminoglycoside phosphotransferase family protein [Candidatus Saccharimonadales bacterium]
MVTKAQNIGIHRKIIQNDDAVHRPTHYWAPAVHGLLEYLNSVDFKSVPQVLGVDEQGREILSYIEGESGPAGWSKITTDEGLAKFAKYLRKYHDAVRNYKPPAGSKWAYGHDRLEPGEIICHGDFGPWNIVWDGNDPVGIIDWDMARPAKPEFDILYALEFATPFRNDKAAIEWHHFTEVPDRKHRIAVFLKAYGTDSIPNITKRVANVVRKVNAGARTIASQGIEPQATWLKDGTLDGFENLAKWIENNKQLFEN